MRSRILVTAAVGLLTASGLVACADDGAPAAGGDSPMIGVILPDSASSVRWESADRRFLAEAFDAAGIDYDIQNAQGDRTAFQTIADQMMTNGATVLMIVNLDSGTGKAVLDTAASQGVATIDYDRLTLGGGAAYYVSFDNVAVGRLQGEGLATCLADQEVADPVVAYLNGSPTDHNASLFREGYDSVLEPEFGAGDFVKGPDQDVPDWDSTEAATIFEQMMTQTDNEIHGVLAANDALGNAAISVLRRLGLNGTVPVTGQDATVQGLQNILTGDQCMTVYKAIRQEAEAAAELAIALANGEQPETEQTVTDPETGEEVPSVLLEPQAIFADNVQDVIDDGYVTVDELCDGEFADICDEAGLS
ncbi:substrate-binding domain-containing protein [Natronosporangium hydrolyticum]|uniref:Substrate-binding domain-containing protein n=1 Tax=Natronosporangium hydrolyticum TaxID=2811111 RepID=A0A895YHR3_9ACTN|nr:substrate-binding domain-containing protein [Natronosporangium hydrolyticum]QSB13690.1 substrate-binding domain-containing protein [Natronosporangium hydrolyticum]